MQQIVIANIFLSMQKVHH